MDGERKRDFIADQEEVELGKASLSESLSETSFDDQELKFHSTVDRLRFNTAEEVISKLLEAHGYVANFENVLACMDSLRFTVKVAAKDNKASLEDQIIAKSYLDAISFNLPQKNRVGPLLKRFYQEIAAYESEILKIKGDQAKQEGATKKKKTESPEKMQQRIDKLEFEKKELESEISRMATKMKSLEKIQARASRAIESNNLLPPDVRAARVREVLPNLGRMTVRAGRTSINIPLHIAGGIPQVDQPCLVYSKDGQQPAVFFYGEPIQKFERRSAEVLYVADNFAKFRDVDRVTWNIEDTSQRDFPDWRQLKRGQLVTLEIADGYLMGFQAASQSNPERFSDKIQEELCVNQLMRSEGVAEALLLDRDSNEEVA